MRWYPMMDAASFWRTVNLLAFAKLIVCSGVVSRRAPMRLPMASFSAVERVVSLTIMANSRRSVFRFALYIVEQ